MKLIAGLLALLLLGTVAAQVPEIPPLPGPGSVPSTPPAPPIPGEPPALPPAPDPNDPPVSPPSIPDPALPAFRLPNGSSQPAAPLLEYQHAIWRDGEHVRDVPRDGYDLIDLRAWEIDNYDHGAGLLLRLEVSGSALLGVEQYVIEGKFLIEESNATPSILLWTTDGEKWASDHRIMQQEYTAEADLVPGTLGSPRHHVIHLLVSYERLNATIGQTVSDWRFTAYADSGETVRRTDVAPGGYYLAGQVEFPEPNAAGEIDNESLASSATEPPALFLRGAGQHIDIFGEWEDGVATMTIVNPYQETAQFIALAYPQEATPYAATNGWVQPNGSLQLQFAVPQKQSAYTLQWDVRSSIGGVAKVEVTLPAIPPPPTPDDPEPEPSEEPVVVPLKRTDPVATPPAATPPAPPATPPAPSGEDSPGVGALALIAVGVALWLRKR